MAFVPRLTKGYGACLSELHIKAGSTQALAVARAVRTISSASALPLAGDPERPLPAKEHALYEGLEGRALLSADAHRVGTRRLWLWYCVRRVPRRAGDVQVVDFVEISNTPPTPG